MEGKPEISGIKILSDRYGRMHDYLRLSITDRCNLRCNYCMPSNPVFLSHKNLLTIDEIDFLCSVFVSLGIHKIRITGGEALARQDFSEIARRIARYNIPMYLTTNGTLLHKHIDLIADTFQSVNISLDTLRSERFLSISQRNIFEQVLKNIHLAIRNHISVKINMVVVRGSNHDEIPDFIRLTQKYPVEIRFIEFMPFSNNKWERMKSFSYYEMLDIVRNRFDIVALEKKESATADMYRVKNAPGSFGIIATISHSFCRTCNRMRVTADGKIKNCLFGSEEYDLRSAIPDKGRLKDIIEAALQRKHLQHGGNSLLSFAGESNNFTFNRSMAATGG